MKSILKGKGEKRSREVGEWLVESFTKNELDKSRRIDSNVAIKSVSKSEMSEREGKG